MISPCSLQITEVVVTESQMLEIAITDFKELIALLKISIRLVGVRIDEITDDTEV